MPTKDCTPYCICFVWQQRGEACHRLGFVRCTIRTCQHVRGVKPSRGWASTISPWVRLARGPDQVAAVLVEDKAADTLAVDDNWFWQ